jgi:hypothetical protein
MVPDAPNFFVSWPLFYECVRSVAQPRMLRGQMRKAADAGAEQQCTMLCRAAQGESREGERNVSWIGIGRGTGPLLQNKNVGDCWRVPVLAGCLDRLEWTPLPVVSCVTGAEPGLSLVAIPEYGRTAARFRQYPPAMSLCNQHRIRLNKVLDKDKTVKGARLCRCSKQDSCSPELLLFMLARGPGSAGLAQPANVIRQATPAGPIPSA